MQQRDLFRDKFCQGFFQKGSSSGGAKVPLLSLGMTGLPCQNHARTLGAFPWCRRALVVICKVQTQEVVEDVVWAVALKALCHVPGS